MVIISEIEGLKELRKKHCEISLGMQKLEP